MEKLFDYLRYCLQRQVFAVVVLALTVPKRSGAVYLFSLCKSMTASFFFFFFYFRGSFFFQFQCVFALNVYICVSMYLCIHAHVFK